MLIFYDMLVSPDDDFAGEDASFEPVSFPNLWLSVSLISGFPSP